MSDKSNKNSKPDTANPANPSKAATPPPLSRDQRKLRNFYNFQINQQKFDNLRKQPPKLMWKYFRNGLVFGFLLEMMMVGTRIYENIIRSTTTKRLEAKRAENRELLKRKKLAEEAKAVL